MEKSGLLELILKNSSGQLTMLTKEESLQLIFPEISSFL